MLLAVFLVDGITATSHEALLGIPDKHHDKVKDKILPSLCLNGYPKKLSEHLADVESWKNCVINGSLAKREDIIGWVKRGFDQNNDDEISMEECEFTQNYYLTPEQRKIEPCSVVFERCNCDNDGGISIQDFLMAEYTCLRNCDVAYLMWVLIGSKMPSERAFDGIKAADDSVDLERLERATGKKLT